MSLSRQMLITSALLFTLQFSLFSQEIGTDSEQTIDPASIQSENPTTPVFRFGLGIGAVNLIDEEGNNKIYNSIRLNPDLAIGKFGIGLDIDFRFTLDGDSGTTEFKVYEPDWYLPGASFKEYFNLYLSKFDYIRWGQSGDDLFAKIGSIESATIGNGFILGGYTNENFKPQRKYTGFRFELDTALFNWPYMGIELFASNISELDLMAARYYVKPLGGIQSPVFSGLEIGINFAVDRNPFFFVEDLYSTLPEFDPVIVYGVDIMQPLLDIKIFTMALYGDYVLQGTSSPTMGGSTGLGGSLIKIISWNMGIIIRGNDFVPTYFNRTYDLDRLTKYRLYDNNHRVPLQEKGIDYKASLGFNFLDGGISFVAQVNGPFASPVLKDPVFAPWEYPHIMALFTIGEGIIPYFDMSFWYDKQGIDSASALISADNALIGGRLNYRIQSAVVSLQVDVKYDPGLPDDWQVTTKLETGIQF
ncbi:MAG: hypothetical protein JEY91_07035 [Spirochaetaceae bacterium]|nr:hypothetical protein [Spirochaetaceae bacterium]